MPILHDWLENKLNDTATDEFFINKEATLEMLWKTDMDNIQIFAKLPELLLQIHFHIRKFGCIPIHINYAPLFLTGTFSR
jgi:hypothetical protein